MTTLLAALLTLSIPAHGAAPFAETRFVGASVHVDVDPVGDQAAGVVDCGFTPVHAVLQVAGATGATVGGQCVDVSRLPPGTELFVTVSSDIGGHASFFIGFDRNGDGCVGCTPDDKAREGTDTVAIFKPDPLTFGPGANTLLIFVRAVSIQPDDPTSPLPVAASGTETTQAFPPDQGPCPQNGGPTASQQDCGEDFNNTGPYPYQGV